MRYYLLLLGLPMVVYGLILAVRQTAFLLRSRKVEGTLSGWKQSAGRSRVYWYPEVSYVTVDGSEYQVVGATGSHPKPSYEIGRRFPVRYDPSAPERACISTFTHLWGASLGFLVLGGVCLAAVVQAWR